MTRARRLELLASIVKGAMEDLELMKLHHPPSKRGSNYTRALGSLERRLAALEQLGELPGETR
jgi:hypothetical protein